jgi:hypothetical protein
MGYTFPRQKTVVSALMLPKRTSSFSGDKVLFD